MTDIKEIYMPSDDAIALFRTHILPFWRHKVRMFELTKTYDKKSIVIMYKALREIDDYFCGIGETLARNSINYLKEAIIPGEARKALKKLSYYEDNSNQYYLDEIIKFANDISAKKRHTGLGYSRHYNMSGEQISIIPNSDRMIFEEVGGNGIQ